MAAESKIAKLFVELGFKDDDFKKGIAGASKDLEKFGGKLSSFGKKLDGMVVKGFKAATASAVAFGTSVAITGARFEQSMATVSAITGRAGADLDALKERARDLGATTTFSATQAADAMQQLARAGLTTNEIIGASGPALQFAGAMGADMSQATSMLASTMSQFGLNASDSTRIVDTFTSAVNSSLLDVTKLQEAMKYAGTAGAAFGHSLEDTTAAVGMFANLGLEGSQAGMNFRMAMIAAGKSTAKKEKIMKKLKMSMDDINPAMNSFEDIMRKIGESGMSTTEAIQIFGSRAGSNVAKIAQDVTNSSDSWVKLNEAIDNSAGVTEATYDTMTNTVQGQFTILKSTIQETQLSLFDGMQEGMTDLLKAWIEVFQLVGMVLNDSQSGIAKGWGDTMSGMADSVRDNKAALAGDIIEMIEFFGNLIHIISKLVGWVKNLAKVMLTIFVARQAYALASTIMTVVIPAFTAATTAAGGLSAAINSMTMGIPLLVGGIAAGVTALFAWGGGMSEAEKAAEKLQARIELLADAEKRRRDGLIEGLEASSDTQRDWLHLLETELNLSGEVGNAITSEIENLRGANATALADMIDAGDAFRATLSGGEDIVMSTALLTRLAADEQLDANGHFKAALDAHAELQAQRLADDQAHVDAIKSGIAEQEELAKERIEVSNVIASPGGGTSVLTVTTKVKTEGALEAERALVSYTDLLATAEQALETTKKTAEGFVAAKDATIQQMAREAAALKKLQEEQDAAERRRNYDQVVKDRQAAADATERILQQSIEAERQSAGEEEAVVREKHRQRIAEINEAFDKESSLWRRNAQKQLEIEARRNQAITATNRSFWQQYVTDVQDGVQETQTAIETESMNEIQLLQEKHRQQLVELERGQRAMVSVTEEGSTERLRAEEQFADARESLVTSQTNELNALQRKLNKKHLDEMMRQSTDAARSEMSELERLQHEENDAIAKALEDGLQTEQAIRDFYAGERRRLRGDTDDRILELLDNQGFRVLQLERERDKLLANMANHSGEERAAITEHYEGLIQEELEDTGDEAEGQGKRFLEMIAEMGKAAWDDITGGLASIGEALGAVGKGLRLDKLFDWIGGGFEKLGKKMKESKLGEWAKGAKKSISEFGEAAKNKLKNAGEAIANSGFGQAVGAAIGVAGKALGGLGQVAQGIGKFFVIGARVGGKAIKGIAIAVGGVVQAVGAMKNAFSSALDHVAALTGFTFNLADAASQVNDQMAERKELEAKLSEGGLSADEREQIQNQLADLPANAAEASSTFIDDLINSSIGMVQTFAEAAPVLLTELAAKIPDLVDAIAAALPEIAEAIGTAIPDIVQAIAAALPDVLDALAQAAEPIIKGIVEAIPVVITAIGEALPVIIGVLSNAVVTLMDALPEIIGALMQALPGIITALVSSIADIVKAFVAMLPDLIAAIVEALPALIVALVDAVLMLITVILAEWPKLIVAVLDAIPTVINAVIGSIPQVVTSIVDALPGIVTALVENLPLILVSLVEMIPALVVALVENIPAIVKALLFELVPALIVAAAEMAVGFIKKIFQFFKDLLTEIWGFIKHPFKPDKRPKTETFGDTPGVQDAGAGGAFVQFAPGDLFVAAKRPEDLLMQVVKAFEGSRTAALPVAGGVGAGNMLEGLGSALMAAASSMQEAAGGGGGSSDLRVTVTAEGRTLDDVLYIGGKRGHTPHLTKEIQRTSGAHIGFDRGRYSPSS